MSFDWDDANTSHIARHNISTEKVVEFAEVA
jgi:uncharacterized DUF497 family protein